jgi:hypothetical protein
MLREQLELWASVVPELEIARPDLPAELDDRAQDSAEPLLAVADLAGSDWPERARRALVELHGGREVDDESAGVRLLADIQTAFGESDRLASSYLLEDLHALDEAGATGATARPSGPGAWRSFERGVAAASNRAT